MQWPFESRIPPFLTNFDFANEYDRHAYEYLEQPRKYKTREYVADLKAIATGDNPQGEMDDASWNRTTAAMIAEAEMRTLVMILDYKISMLARLVKEPYPEFFKRVGVSPEWEGHSQSQDDQEKQKADLKAQLRIIKGGQE